MKRLLFCIAVLVTLLADESQAQWWGGGYGLGNYYNRGIYVDQERIPYFALHPPVYYSYPVPRPYGFSPFAYPGMVSTPEYQVREPAVLVNPYATEGAPTPAPPKSPMVAPPAKIKKSAASDPAKGDRLGAVAPLRIANPFSGLRYAATER